MGRRLRGAGRRKISGGKADSAARNAYNAAIRAG